MELVRKSQRDLASRDVLKRAEDALLGLAQRDLHLPMPDDHYVRPDQPNHLWGWLPEEVLGTEPPRSIMYAVDKDLVNPPGALRFIADPMQLIPNPPPPGQPFLKPRGAANGLDLCLKIIQSLQSAAARMDDVQVAFGVLEPSAHEVGRVQMRNSQFASRLAGTSKSRSPINTEMTGHIEIVHRLGCIGGLARLTTEVKSAALFNDLYQIARIIADLKALELQAARDYLHSHRWRRDVAVTNLLAASLRVSANLISMETSPAGLIALANVVPLSMAVALWVLLLEMSDKGKAATSEALPKMTAAHEQAERFAADLLARRDLHVERANLFQERGLKP